jgi:outer membrane protein TolC
VWKNAGKPLVPVIAAAVVAGCATFEARPIAPEETEAAFKARTLSDPELCSYLATGGEIACPPRDLDPQTLTRIALYFHPDLEVARARTAIAEAGIITAGARPNPSLGTHLGYSDAPGAPWLYGVTFDIPVETAGKRGYRIVRAEQLTEATRLQLGEAAWQVRSYVRAALVQHLLAVREVDLLRAEEHTRSAAVTLMEQRLAAGEVSRPEVDVARTDLNNIKLATRAAEGIAAESRSALATALGLPLTALEGTIIVWPGIDRPPTEQTLAPAPLQRAGLLNRLDVRRALAEYGATEAALQLEVAKQYPDLHFGPAYSFDDAQSKFTLGVSITLPVLNQNQGPIAEAEARRRQAAAQVLALQAQIIGETDSALARYSSASAELAEADRLVAGLDEQVGAVQRAVEVGESDRLALAGVQVQRAVALRARLTALRKTQAALGALEDAVQRPLDSLEELPDTAPQQGPNR